MKLYVTIFTLVVDVILSVACALSSVSNTKTDTTKSEWYVLNCGTYDTHTLIDESGKLWKTNTELLSNGEYVVIMDNCGTANIDDDKIIEIEVVNFGE